MLRGPPANDRNRTVRRRYPRRRTTHTESIGMGCHSCNHCGGIGARINFRGAAIARTSRSGALDDLRTPGGDGVRRGCRRDDRRQSTFGCRSRSASSLRCTRCRRISGATNRKRRRRYLGGMRGAARSTHPLGQFRPTSLRRVRRSRAVRSRDFGHRCHNCMGMDRRARTRARDCVSSDPAIFVDTVTSRIRFVQPAPQGIVGSLLFGWIPRHRHEQFGSAYPRGVDLDGRNSGSRVACPQKGELSRLRRAPLLGRGTHGVRRHSDQRCGQRCRAGAAHRGVE